MDRKTNHHFWWPKRIYRHNRVIRLKQSIHQAYHNYFDHKCRKKEQVKSRLCLKGFCKYENLCCYCGTATPYGKKVKL